MSRLIDADALEQSIKGWYCAPERCNSYNGIMCRACHIDDALSEIDRAPIVDAEPVRHGRWIEVDEGDGDYTYNCSVCELKWWLPADTTAEENEMNYCPRCGAKMDGD